MQTIYKCYFDGSYTPEMSGCAFCVKMDGQILHSHVRHEKLDTSSKAEMLALYALFQHIQQHIEPGSVVEIYGDHKSLLAKMEGKCKRRNRSATKRLYRELLTSYNLTLHFIPGKSNRTAHKLARTEYIPLPNPRKILRIQDYALGHNKIILMDDISIPDCMRYGR